MKKSKYMFMAMCIISTPSVCELLSYGHANCYRDFNNPLAVFNKP